MARRGFFAEIQHQAELQHARQNARKRRPHGSTWQRFVALNRLARLMSGQKRRPPGLWAQTGND